MIYCLWDRFNNFYLVMHVRSMMYVVRNTNVTVEIVVFEKDI